MARDRIPVIVRPVEVKKPGRWAHKCGFTKLDGALCERWAIKGGYVCPKHGGRLPGVRVAARARLERLSLLAIGVYAEVLMEGSTAKDVDRLRAAKDVLRMVGFHNSGTMGRQSHALMERTMAGELEPAPDAEIEALLGSLLSGSEQPQALESGERSEGEGE